MLPGHLCRSLEGWRPCERGSMCTYCKSGKFEQCNFSVNGKRHRLVRKFFSITYSGLLGVRLLECTRGNHIYTSV